jgi:cytochrome P450
MRRFGPPHSPDIIPDMGKTCVQIVNELLDQAKGKIRIDVVDDYAYPQPVDVICRIVGVPLKDEPLFHAWIADVMAGIFDVGPEIETEEGQRRRENDQGQCVGAGEIHDRAGRRGRRETAWAQNDFADGARRRATRADVCGICSSMSMASGTED